MVAKYRGKPAPGWGWEVPGVMNSMAKGTQGVALTFDACGGPGKGSGYDEKLINLLRKHKVKATLNLNLRWINANPGATKELLADSLFDIQSHGKRHLPLSIRGRSAYGEAGTKNVGEIYDELVGEDPWFLENLHRLPRFMRPGTAFVDNVAAAMARDLRRPIMGFSVNGDAGTTFTASQIVTSLLPVRNGDIVISHMNRPEHQTAEGYALVLPRLLDRGVKFIHLPDVS